ncbi:acyl-CoA dehydrogenase family protein [Mycobacterium branderi]|uniref:Acyl-CoA dehydrogenase n=1 Tax=Mycobacterium branderi TaxID=43348 RepID=A0A7I7VZV9_9MYCO|nr:acyl-CoA dehydrogenase family protein [Mycobacterium branderi]MCV7232940.1 acyl-CoA/acyl-ACP dehydrogenase [Mycobacterium branderi]ORA41057.1 acyl-CoA dehydrogenase [Mycobacterium branderi]BBZ10045.1 acyl-CoA dehydrogenase [Mycobacterium branderi]
MADQNSITSAQFVFTPEQQELRTAVRGFCAEHSDKSTVRQLMESTPPFDQKSWLRLGSELGVLGLGVPEELGGSGGGLVDAAIAVEELGAALFCGPVFGTLALSIPALVAAPKTPVRAETLGPLVAGTRTAAFAVPEQAGRLAVDAVTLRANGSRDTWFISGTVERVVDAGAADDLLVAATGPGGVALFVVDATGPGVERTALSALDMTRPQAAIRLADAPARLVAGPEAAPRICEHALQVGAVLLAAEQVGGAQHLLDLSVSYAKERLQFGRPIGSFQAVKHKLADMLVDQEHARSAAYYGAWALQDGSDDPALASSIAQATCSAAFTRIAADTIQVHGGIGFTWEHQAHLYFKRAFTDAALLGSAEEHRSRIAELVLDNATPSYEITVATG